MVRFLVSIVILLHSSAWGVGLRLTLINVGHGDAIFLRSHSGATMLVDCGDIPGGPKKSHGVRRFFRGMRLRQLNYLVLTHPHRDHIGGVQWVLANVRVGCILDPGYPSPSPYYSGLLRTAADRSIPVRFLRAGDKIRFAPQIQLRVLNPPRRLYRHTHSDPNNNSLVLHLRYLKFSCLLCGDAEEAALRDMTGSNPGRLRCRVLKVPHHGSRTSIHPPFLKAVAPDLALISVGPRGGSHPFSFAVALPHPKTIAAYAKLQARLLRSDRHGDISVETDGTNIRVFTERQR